MNFRDVHIHTHAGEVRRCVSLGGLLCCFTQHLKTRFCPAILHCDSTDMASDLPFGRYSPNATWVVPSRSEPPNDLNSLELLWGWKKPAVPIATPTSIYQTQQERPRVITTTQLQLITKTNRDQIVAHSPTPTSTSSPQPPLSQVPTTTVAKKWLLKTMSNKSS